MNPLAFLGRGFSWHLLARWEDYDPAWLVALARQQYPDDPAFADALARCTRAAGAGSACVHFVDPVNANRPGAEWQFDRNEALEDADVGEVIVDVLRDGRIGAIELLDVLLGVPGTKAHMAGKGRARAGKNRGQSALSAWGVCDG